jgi:environmental stress-induced protein Ves
MRRISRSQWQRQPWRNGGGVTWEIWRDGDGPPGFVVRLSCAEVASDGPFSRFPGVDRVIALVEGAGMVLDGASPHALTEPLAPYAFPGEAEVHGRLTDGAVLDVNLMTARDEASAHVRRVRLAPGERTELTGATVIVFAPRGSVTVTSTNRRYTLAPMDTVIACEGLAIEAGPAPEAIWVAELLRRDAPTRVPPPPGLAALFDAAVVEIAGPPLAEPRLEYPTWVITACNPSGSLLSADENAERMIALEAALSSRGVSFRPAVGRDASGDWAEPSFAITGTDRQTVLGLARDFDQDAVYEFDAHGNRTVLWC